LWPRVAGVFVVTRTLPSTIGVNRLAPRTPIWSMPTKLPCEIVVTYALERFQPLAAEYPPQIDTPLTRVIRPG
jgi:hypothetical protein